MPAKKPKTSMWIEPAPKTFTDKNLERGYGEGGANNYVTRNPKPGGTMSPIQRSIKIPRTNPTKA